MNVIDRSKFVDDEGKISLKNRLNATLDFGSNWYGRMESQNAVTHRMGRALGDQHILLRNVTIPGIDEGEPFMILVSPQGIRILMAFPDRGVFRANEGEWLKLNQRSRSFVRTKPNLQMVALNIQKQVQRLLDIQNFNVPVIESVLIFTHPRTLIDGSRPTCRVVSADAIEYFAANLEQLPSALNVQKIHSLVDGILYPKLPEPRSADRLITDPRLRKPVIPEPKPTTQPAFYADDFDDIQESAFAQVPTEDLFGLADEFYLEEETFHEFLASEPIPTASSRERKPPRKGRMSGKQWFFIGILAIIQIIVTIIFIYIILRDLGML